MATFEKESDFLKTLEGDPQGERNPYKEFVPGQIVFYGLKTLNPDGSVSLIAEAEKIEKTRTGGFFGKVLILKNAVIKTSLPDPFRHYWRSVNWDYSDLPARFDETWAQLEHLSTKIIHDVLSVISHGRFYSPDSLGYTRLSTGFAQVIEKIDDGRPDKLEPDESEAFRNAQKELLELGKKLGLEQIGQVHPDNPFGMQNLWLNPKTGTFVWLDTNPAIPQRKVIKPFLRYRHYRNLSSEFGKEVIFNEIHTDRLFAVLYSNKKLFSEDDFARIIENVKLYKKLYENRSTIPPDPKISQKAWAQFEKDLLTENWISQLLTDPEFRNRIVKNVAKYFTDPKFRKKHYEEIILSGTKRAYENKVITEEQFISAKKTIEEESLRHPRKATIFPTLFAWYLISGQVVNAIELGIYTDAFFLANDKLATAVAGVLVGRGVPLILNPLSTMLTGFFTKTDLREAAKFSAFPIAGPLIAIPAQIRKDIRGSDLLWHYLIRNLVAKMSRLDPAGGFGSEREAKTYRTGKKIIKGVRDKTQKLESIMSEYGI